MKKVPSRRTSEFLKKLYEDHTTLSEAENSAILLIRAIEIDSADTTMLPNQPLIDSLDELEAVEEYMRVIRKNMAEEERWAQ